jgi:tight adherence protein B
MVVATGLVLGTAAVRFRRSRDRRRRTVACAALLEALEVVIGELRVGAHPAAASAVAAGEVGGSVARAFAVSSARSGLGGSAAQGLRDPHSIVAAELSRIADSWAVAEQYGLGLGELLASARTDLFGRIRFRDRAEAALAGPRATASVLAGLPLLGIGLGEAMGAQPLSVLFGAGIGAVLLPLGAGLGCAGLLWTDSITKAALS